MSAVVISKLQENKIQSTQNTNLPIEKIWQKIEDQRAMNATNNKVKSK